MILFSWAKPQSAAHYLLAAMAVAEFIRRRKGIYSLARGAGGTGLHGDLVELYSLPPKKKDRKKKGSKARPPRFEVRKFSNVQPMSF